MTGKGQAMLRKTVILAVAVAAMSLLPLTDASARGGFGGGGFHGGGGWHGGEWHGGEWRGGGWRGGWGAGVRRRGIWSGPGERWLGHWRLGSGLA